MTFRMTIILIVFGIILLVSPGAVPAGEDKAGDAGPPATDAREMIVTEPVFKGTVYIAEAGMRHPVSVVLVHGDGNRGARDWEHLFPELAKRYHVVAFDLPGFGRSSKSNELYSPAKYATFIKWAADRYVRAPFVLIGHSLGAALALRYAADFPDDLRRLILVDAAGILNQITYTKEVYLMNNADVRSGTPSRRVEEFDEFVRFMLDDLSSEQRARKLEGALQKASLRKVMLGGDPKKIAAMAVMLEDFGASVEQIVTPTLLIWGENDKIAPFRTAEALEGMLPGARLEVIGQAGHVPMLDRTEQFNRIIMEELESMESGSAPAATALRPRQEIQERFVRYDHQQGLSLTGGYKRIELYHCSDMKITDATIERIDVVGSDVTIENSSIKGTDVALSAKKSEIIATNVTIEADTAIDASHSHLDLAGVRLTGRKAAVATKNGSILLFSISHSDSPYYSGPLHGSRKVTKRRPL